MERQIVRTMFSRYIAVLACFGPLFTMLAALNNRASCVRVEYAIHGGAQPVQRPG